MGDVEHRPDGAFWVRDFQKENLDSTFLLSTQRTFLTELRILLRSEI